MTTWGLDVSNHKPWGFDFPRAKREGYTFCFTKATEGTSYTDKNWYNRGSDAGYAVRIPEAGLIPGAYHFLRAGDGAAQARYFLTRVKDAGGPTGWVCSCDCEADASWDTLYAFYAEWQQLTGGHPLPLYTGAWWWNIPARGWDAHKLPGGLPWLWLSRYVAGSGYGSVLYEKVPTSWWTAGFGGWGQAQILQFSSSGVVAGTSAIDVNAYEGDVAALYALTRAGGTPPTPTTPGGTVGLSTADKDPYGEGPDGVVRDQAAMLRDLYYAAGLGYEIPGVTPGSPVAALARIEQILREPVQSMLMTDEQYQQFVELMRADQRAAIVSGIKQALDPLLQALGAYGDALAPGVAALGTLNDIPEGGVPEAPPAVADQ